VTCYVPECDGTPITKKGLCGKHYQRWRTHGDPLIVLPRRGNSTERFSDVLAYFNTQWSPDSDGCRIWHGSTDRDGYGRFYPGETHGKFRTDKAHRWIFGEVHHYLPPVVMHQCDKPPCVNWEACRVPGTITTNNEDMHAKGRAGHGVSGPPKGERHGNSKLSDRQAAELKSLFGTMPQRVLADLFGISVPAVSLIGRGLRRA
jgi:hypothetical protein